MAVDTTQSWQEHTSDGSTAYFSFNFNYDTTRPGTIVVGKRTADNTYSVVDASDYELIPNASGDGGQIRFIQNPSGSQVIDDIPPAGTIVRIERVSVDTSSATWQIGLDMSELVNLFDRLFRLVQENKGGFDNVIKTFETQHDVSLYEMLATHDNRLFFWDNTNKTITPTDFPKEDVVRCVNGLFFRVSVNQSGIKYLEWSENGSSDWKGIDISSVNALAQDAHDIATQATNAINTHIADTNNPHSVTKAQVGLGNVDNTSDANKPISTATQTALNAKQDTISDLATIRTGASKGATAVQPGDLATVATSGSYNDLSNKPTIGDGTITIKQSGTIKGTFTTNQTGNTEIDLDAGGTGTVFSVNGQTGTVVLTASDVGAATSGQGAKADTAVQPGDNVSELVNDAGYVVMGDLTGFVTRTTAQTISGLKTFTADIVLSETTSIKNTTSGVSYTMLYRDASGIHVGTSTQALLLAGSGTRPTFNSNNMALLSDVPTAVSQLTNDSGFITNAVNDLQNYTLTSALATVATSGSYNDLSNKPTIPTVNNPTITITQGGVTKGSFTLNQATDDTIDIDAGGGSSYHPELFSHEWDDHERNNMSWVNALTFSWQNKTDHEVAYQHLVDDYNNVSYVSIRFRLHEETIVCTRNAQHDIVSGEVQYYAWERNDISDSFVYTTSVTPEIGSTIYNSSLSALTTVSGFVDGSSTETIAGITITYYQAPDGHKLVLPDQESNIEAIYLATGVAWYYIIDTTNERFKLPRAKHNKYANSLAVVGTGKALGLYDGTNNCGTYNSAGHPVDVSSGNIGKDVGTSTNAGTGLSSGKIIGVSTDPTKSGLIAQQTQDTDQYKYLYFYVGEFTQTAIENTAGLNASLFNNKADLDLANVLSNIDFVVDSQLPTAANNYTWYRKYKSGWVEQGGIATNTSTADRWASAQVSFPIEMADTNYVALGTAYGMDSVSTVLCCIGGIDSNNQDNGTSKTTTGMVLQGERMYSGGPARITKWQWQVSGMAQG